MNVLATKFKIWISIGILSLISCHSIAKTQGLFETDKILEISLIGDFESLFKDTKGQAQYFDFSLSLVDNTPKKTGIPLKIKTRGNFRREMNICSYPPLMLNFTKKGAIGTPFENQDKLKLVMPCKGEKYLLKEYYAYKVFNLFTPYSFNVRLVKVNFTNLSSDSKEVAPLLAFIIEDEQQMASRNGMVSLEQELIRPESTNQDDFLRMAVFQFLIGNSDWSIQYRQNIKLMHVDKSSLPTPVPYDFDHSGIVNAPYAKPAPELEMLSVVERRYRGFCIEDLPVYEEILAVFNSKRDAINAIYLKSELLDEKSVKSTIKYLDGFFDIVNNPKKLKSEFQYPCLEEGTGNVVIKGLKK